MKKRYYFTVHLSGGQSIRHFVEFNTEEEYDQWVRSSAPNLLPAGPTVMPLDNPDVWYRAEHIAAVQFEGLAREPGMRFLGEKG